jgi:hypothetical protein
MVGVEMHLVSAPPADDCRRETLGDASYRFPHLRREQGMAWLGRWEWETGRRSRACSVSPSSAVETRACTEEHAAPSH